MTDDTNPERLLPYPLNCQPARDPGPQKKGPGRPRDENAIRRTGKRVGPMLARTDHEAYTADAHARGMSLPAHMVDLLQRWHAGKTARQLRQGAKTPAP